jgi:2-polyprenyl-3-methyl-5-hydroxy-6-metoxy-1,4-benzoquinol methylase
MPPRIVKALHERNVQREKRTLQRIYAKYGDLTTQQVFTKIYEEGEWGKSPDRSQKYFSGLGSREEVVVATYIDAVSKFLSSFERKPDVVDLGCGDFYVGSNLRRLCAGYTACDIVQPLIDMNKEKYKMLDVDFRVLDLTVDELPPADVVFLRQVLQHLSNEQVKNALQKVTSNYKYLILTEHLPGSDDFVHNVDKPAGPTTRLRGNSGVVLTSPPFNLAPKAQKVLCQVSVASTLIRTTLYCFA